MAGSVASAWSRVTRRALSPSGAAASGSAATGRSADRRSLRYEKYVRIRTVRAYASGLSARSTRDQEANTFPSAVCTRSSARWQSPHISSAVRNMRGPVTRANSWNPSVPPVTCVTPQPSARELPA